MFGKIVVNKYNAFKWFVVSLLTCDFYYNGYRYIFQINNSVTSPIYSDTPALLQYGKYLIYFLILSVYLMFQFQDKNKCVRFNSKQRNFLYLLVSFVVFTLLFGLLYKNKLAFQIAAFFALPLVVLLGRKEIDFKFLNKNIYFFCVFSTIYDIIQVALFFMYGRLPALGWPGSFSVRFGATWDDPNGWGIFISFMLPFLYYYSKTKRKRIIWTFVCSVLLLLTQSVTAVLTVIIGIWIHYLKMAKSKDRIYITIIKLFFLFLCLLFYLYVSGYLNILYDSYQTFQSAKSGSVNGHMEPYIRFFALPIAHVIVGGGDIFGESDVVNMISLGGLFYFLLFVVMYVKACGLCLVQLKKYRSPFWHASYSFICAFGIAIINLPVTSVFPINLLICIIILLCFQKNENDNNRLPALG